MVTQPQQYDDERADHVRGALVRVLLRTSTSTTHHCRPAWAGAAGGGRGAWRGSEYYFEELFEVWCSYDYVVVATTMIIILVATTTTTLKLFLVAACRHVLATHC